MPDEEITKKTRPTKIVHCRVNNADYSALGTSGEFTTLKEALTMLEPILTKACASMKSRHLVIGVFLEGQEEAGPYSAIEINVRPSKSRLRRQKAEKEAGQ